MFRASFPTGIDRLEVIIGDPTWAEGHTAQSAVYVAVDNTAPELTLSGPLTEQDFRGTLGSEYPLTISAEDGANNAPQSGVAKVEVKVDGKKITMPKESAWNPNCQGQNCSFSGTWTLKAAEYTAGNHEVEVLADRRRRAEIRDRPRNRTRPGTAADLVHLAASELMQGAACPIG